MLMHLRVECKNMKSLHSKLPRRAFLSFLVGGTAIVAVQGWTAHAASEPEGGYQPTYFTPIEWRFLNAACDRLIPSDEHGPGAVVLGVPEFIDRQMDTPYAHGSLWYMGAPFISGPDNLGYQLPYAPRELYRRGIQGANAYAKAQFGSDFASLDHATQEKILRAFEGGHVNFGDISAKLFFSQLLTNTKEGAFSDPKHGGNKGLGGWTMLGFPGARADFMDWVDQYGKQYPLGTVSISGETA